MKILIVDDEPANLEVMMLAMEMEGFEVFPLNTAKNFISVAKNIAADVILLDIELDGFDGRELCKELKITKGLSNTPVIIVSATSEMKILSSVEYGADFIINKPFDIEELTRAVKHCLAD